MQIDKETPEKMNEDNKKNIDEKAGMKQEGNHIDSISDVPDLDGDGMIGHTGGMYGATTYTGGSITVQTEYVEDAPKKEVEEEEDEEEEK